MARLEKEAIGKTGKALPDPVPEPPIAPGRVSELLKGRNLRNSVVLSVGCVLVQIGFFGYNAYVPTLLADSGYTTSQTLMFTSIFSIAAVPGALLAWPIVDKFERKILLAVTTAILGALFVWFGITAVPGIQLATGVLITMLLQSVTVFSYAYLPEMFPTHLRGIGAGIANGLGRLGVFLGGAVLGIFGMRTTNRPLVENAGTQRRQ